MMRLVGQMLLDQLLSEEVQGYNLYSLFRLNDDALSIAEFASRIDIPGATVLPLPLLLDLRNSPNQ